MTRRRLYLDFAVADAPGRWLGYVLLAAAIVLTGHLVWRYRLASLAIAEIESAPRVPRATPVAPDHGRAKELQSRTQALARIEQQLTLPWSSIIEIMESTVSKEVAILQLEPDAERRTLRIAAETYEYDAMLAYLRTLARSDGIRRAHLVSHQKRAGEAREALHFSVQAEYVDVP